MNKPFYENPLQTVSQVTIKNQQKPASKKFPR